MPKLFVYDDTAPRERIYVQTRQPRRYGCLGFLGDIFMTFLSGGLWLIWIFVREMRKSR